MEVPKDHSHPSHSGIASRYSRPPKSMGGAPWPLLTFIIGWIVYFAIVWAPGVSQGHGEEGLIELAARGVAGSVGVVIASAIGLVLGLLHRTSSRHGKAVRYLGLGLNTTSILLAIWVLLQPHLS